METHRYIVDFEGGFKGHTESATYLEDGIEYVMYSGPVTRQGLHYETGKDLTLAEYLEQPEKAVKELGFVTGPELENLMESWHSDLITPAVRITEEQYWDALECLPPLNWTRNGGFENFFMRERYTATLTNQYATRGDVYLQKMVDLADKSTWISLEDFA